MKQTNTRYHDFSYGHRVCGHEGKCQHLHGHNGRVYFTCEGPLDDIGRIIDFSVIKSTLCDWLEKNWDHKMLLWDRDPVRRALLQTFNDEVVDSIVAVPFNPTCEAMCIFLLNEIGPALLPPTVRLISVKIEETRKCSAIASL